MEIPQWSIGGAYAVFPFLATLFGLETFIETGTAFGEMVVHLYPSFDQLYTIEKSDWAYKISTAILARFNRIHLIHGDSGVELHKLLQHIPNTPTLFWLDAHGPTPGEDDGPITQELLAITEFRPNALIAIDDVGLDKHHDKELSRVGICMDEWVKDYRFGRVLFLHKGQYKIPELGG
jgi:hypothetical protein